MSVHLIECAAEVQLPPALKLALLCFADSGSQDGRIAKPGLDNLMRWTGLKKSRALEVVKHLQELQLLAQHRTAHRGQRAEYIVFPNGCCERHGKSSATVLTVVDVPAIAVSEPLTCASVNGSGTADPFPATSFSTASGTPDPIAGNGSDPVDGMGPIPPPERVRPSRSKVEPSKYYLQEPSPGGTEHQPPTSRDPVDSVSIGFVAPSAARGVRVTTPSGKPLGCRHCDAGFITDADGMPVARCPHCNRATRSETA